MNKNDVISLKKKLIELSIKFIENIDNDLYQSMFILCIFVLTDFKILCINSVNEYFYFNYINRINDKTIFVHYYNTIFLVKIKEIMLKNNEPNW